MVGNQAPGLNIFSKRVIFALSKPYPLFLCTCISTLLKCFFSVLSVGQPPSESTLLQSAPHLALFHFHVTFLTFPP